MSTHTYTLDFRASTIVDADTIEEANYMASQFVEFLRLKCDEDGLEFNYNAKDFDIYEEE